MISSWNSKIFKWQKLRRYWINPIFILSGYLEIFGSQYQTLFQSSFLKFLFLFTLFIPIPVFLGTLQWTDFLHIYLGGHWETMQNDILPGKYYHMPCLHPQSLSLLPLSGDCRYPPYCSLWRPSSPVIWRLLISFLPQPVETFFPSISLLVDFSMSIYWWNKYVIKRREWKRLVKSFVFS